MEDIVSTQESGSADSDITADLTAAFEGYDDDMNEIPPEEENQEVIEGEDEQIIEEESEDGPESEEETGEDEPAEEEQAGIEAPEHWSQTDKDAFNSAPDEIKDWLLGRYKSMEADYTRKTTEVAEFRTAWEPVAQMYAPHIARLAQSGITPQQHIESLANADLLLNQDPIAGIQHVAQLYGIDLSQFAGGMEEGSADPQVAALRQELSELRGSVQRRDHEVAQQEHSKVVSQLESFAEAKTDDGELAHPHFDAVVEDMILLAQAERAAGREPALNDLYEKAVWSNTSVREMMQTAQREAAEQKRQKEARAKAAKAKKASKSVNGSPNGGVADTDLSLREQLEQGYGA